MPPLLTPELGMDMEDADSDDGDKLSSFDLAGLIADALVVGGAIGQSFYKEAEAIVAKVIEARKKIGDY